MIEIVGSLLQREFITAVKRLMVQAPNLKKLKNH
jgi:hypothetical protein